MIWHRRMITSKLKGRADQMEYDDQREKYLQELVKRVPISHVVDNFAKNVSRQELTRLLFRHEMFKKIVNLKGCIVECGVFSGQGLMTWAQLSTIMEPIGFQRRIYGFDTFEGFPQVHENDLSGVRAFPKNVGDIKDNSYDDLLRSIELFDMNRYINHVQKVFLVKGDFMETSEKFLQDNPHTLISLLYLDFDLYEPTKKALEMFLPRMPKGSIIGFDEINNPCWPGETLALLETFNLREIRIEKLPYEPHMAYVVL